MPIEIKIEASRNGDVIRSVNVDGRVIGTVRHNPRTSDYHAVTTKKGSLRSRYFGSQAGAIRWITRQHS